MLGSVNLSLLVGPTVAVPAPPSLAEAIKTVEVTHKDEGRSGFQITFNIGRSGPADLIDYPFLSLPLLRPFNRVILVALVGVVPRVIMDGVITHQQLSPGFAPGTSTLSVTGEDVSVMMDLEKKVAQHPAQDDTLIALKLIASYAQYGLIPLVIPPTVPDIPIPIDRTPVQHATDLEHLNEMAARHGYVFYIDPGPAPLTNTAYWGPPKRLGIPQRALSVNLGSSSNVSGIRFSYNALAPTRVAGKVLDRELNVALPFETFVSTRVPLALQPALPFNLPNVRKTTLESPQGLSYAQAFARAQAQTDESMDAVVTAEGELDVARYGDLLSPRGLVGLRGAGFSYDGLYYVKSVTHKIRRGEYKQSFTLTREGTGSTTPAVIP